MLGVRCRVSGVRGAVKKLKGGSGPDQVGRVRRICMALPGTVEKVSHGEPTFFAGGQRVFCMFSNNHHDDGHVAVWIPAQKATRVNPMSALRLE